jgi:probable phosphoglycerate mutase
MHLILVRHGESVCNLNGVIGGPKGDNGLSDLGRDQVKNTASYLAKYLQDKNVSIYSSVLPRAIQTAEIIAQEMQYCEEIITDCGLCELHPGVLDGLTWNEYLLSYKPFDLREKPYKKLAKGAESWAQFLKRASLTLRKIASSSQSDYVVVACHGGVIQASMIVFLSLKKFGTLAGLNPRYAGITEWSFENSLERLLRYNFVPPN